MTHLAHVLVLLLFLDRLINARLVWLLHHGPALAADVVGRHDPVYLLIVFKDAKARLVITIFKEGLKAVGRID